MLFKNNLGVGLVILLLSPLLVNAQEKGDPIQEKDGMKYICTGIGESKNDPRLSQFSAKVIFASTSRSLYSDVTVIVSKPDGTTLSPIFCDGSWLLMKLNPGVYQIKGTDQKGQVRHCSLTVKSAGTSQCLLSWPD